MNHIAKRAIQKMSQAFLEYIKKGHPGPINSTTNWKKHYGAEDKEMFKKALIDELKQTVFTKKTDRFNLEIERADNQHMYGFKTTLNILPSAPTTIKGLSTQEIYQRNKTRNYCISCGKETDSRPVLGSVVGYCRDCCG